MAKQSNQKLKILYLIKILSEETDDEHNLTSTELINKLEAYGVASERKSLYNDIELLQNFGYDIIYNGKKGYFLGSRDFELPELKLLVDSVQSSKFITKKKSLELIKKLEAQTSKHNAVRLRRHVFVLNRAKTLNEEIYITVDKLYDAIMQNKKITFKYFEWLPNHEKRYRKNGDFYTETPISLSWDDENYYLITYKAKFDSYVHYRVDKITDISILDEARDLPEESFDAAEYSKKIFGMFGGEETAVEVRFNNSLAGVVIDRFGNETVMLKDGLEHFKTRLSVAVSPQFLSWIMGFGRKAEVLYPAEVREKIKELTSEIAELYK